MQILLLDRDFHHKNREALYSYKNISITPFYNPNDLDNFNLQEYDAVYSPTYPIDVSKYPTTIFIFGPHFSVFPEQNLQWIKGPNSIYVQPSKWASDVWKVSPLCKDIPIYSLPFGVNTEKFDEIIPKKQRTQVFVYYKTRDPSDLHFIAEKLHTLNINYQLFSYDAKYSENIYIDCLHNAKYGIWVGRHESQGFALEEALSCNVPLLVWDVLSMNQEYGPNFDDIQASTVPYWDNICGEKFHKREHFDNAYKLFMENLDNYEPRKYILENLTMDKCEACFIQLLQKMTQKKCQCVCCKAQLIK